MMGARTDSVATRHADVVRRVLICMSLAGLALLGNRQLVSAQVAAPSLSPFTFVTENPAAMQWGTPSRVGAAYLQAQQVTSPSSSTDNFEGYSGGFRLATRHFSLAAEGVHLESLNKPYGPSESEDNTRGAIAVGLWSWLAIGVGQNNLQNNLVAPSSTTATTTVTNSIDLDGTPGGISIRIAEWLFLGGSSEHQTGKDKIGVIFNGAGQPSTTANAARDVTQYGVGIRTGGTVLTHFEVYEVDRSKFNYSAVSGPQAATFNGPNPTIGSKETQQTGVAEVNFGGFLISLLDSHIARDSGFPNTDEQIAAIGYAPVTGLTVVLFDDQTTDKEPSGTPNNTNTVTFTKYGLALTYLFDSVK